MEKIDRVVIKVGTNTLTDNEGIIDRGYIASLAEQISSLRSRDIDVALVTSGAIRAGMELMGLIERPTTIPEKQAAAAVGQSFLMQVYSEVFRSRGITIGQVLLTREDFGDRRRYVNARNTMVTLFGHGVVPVVNENDTVAVDEIRVGDNDNLAALVASCVEADLLILLSDVPGLCDADPTTCANAVVIPVVTKIDEEIMKLAGGARTTSGTGGMRTKVEAAQVATSCGVTMVVADGRKANVIGGIVSGEQIGTTFLPKKQPLSGRKRWLAFGARSKGGLVVNDGARKMITDGGKSLLSAGIVEVVGEFAGGDIVKVLDQSGNQFARGFVNYSADEVKQIMGKRSSEIEHILGYKDFDEVIHRDNMVLASR